MLSMLVSGLKWLVLVRLVLWTLKFGLLLLGRCLMLFDLWRVLPLTCCLLRPAFGLRDILMTRVLLVSLMSTS